MTKKIDFKSKGFTILISVFFAVIFWAFVMADSNTTRVMDIRNVPVTFRGAQTLTDNGLVITDRSRDNVTVRIEGGVNVVGYITVNNISAYVDLSQITEPGEYEFVVSSYCNNGSVVVKSVSPAKIRITVEEHVEKQVPVEIVYDKDIPDSYWVNSAEVAAQDNRVTVSGGFTSVQKVARAVVNVNTDRLIQMYEENPNHDYESSISLVYVDENNKEVSGISSQSSIVTISVLSKKTVNIDVQGAIVGTPAEGHSLASVEQSTQTVDIVGKRDIIANINSMSVDEININAARTNVIADVNIKPVDGVSIIGSSTVKVSVNISGNTEN